MTPTQSSLASAATITPNLTKLKIAFTGKPAPKCGERNLWIDIEIDRENRTALFHCIEGEQVAADHKQRTVTFRADHTCQLNFVPYSQTHKPVFKVESLALVANQEQFAPIDDKTTGAGTNYEVYVQTPTENAFESLSSDVVVRGGPHIVVP